MSSTRRYFLTSSGLALASLGAVTHSPSFLNRVLAQTASNGRRKILIAIFQRGAMDGLNAVIPHGERQYYDIRPGLAVPRPKAGDQLAAIDLDGFFGLHPSLVSFKSLYDEKQLAIIHAVGSPDSTRSHYDALEYMETGTPGVKSTTDGWLNRYMQSKVDSKATPFRAVAMSANMPRMLQGKAPSVAMNRITDFDIRAGGGMAGQQVKGGFEAMYGETADKVLHGTGKDTFEAVKILKQANPTQYKETAGVTYPRGRYGDSLRQIAQLIKADVGLEIAFTDIGGWDTHANQGGSQGQLAQRLLEFSQGITALYADLKDRAGDVVILTMTEFGRTARENGNRGTDHGHASVMFALGGEVKGGKVYGKWPGLRPEQLNEGRDLALTTDFREVFAEVAKNHLGASNTSLIFPGYQVNASSFKGFI